MAQPVLHTDRLHLEPVTRRHVRPMHRIWGDPEVIWWGHHQTVDQTEALIDRILERRDEGPPGVGWWLLLERSGAAVGDVVLQPVPRPTGEIEIGWHLASSAWGSGYATEAARRLVAHGFETMGLEVIVADIAAGNTRSQAVATRLGMRLRPEPVDRLGVPHGVWEIHPDGFGGSPAS